MDLQSVFTDNQLAVIGCFLALGVCGAIAGLSFRFGPAGQKGREDSSTARKIHPLPSARTAASGSSDTEETRRAA